MPELHDIPLPELAASFACGDLSPVDLLEHTLDRADAAQEEYNAFVHFDRAGARYAAEASAARWRAGEARGVLDGIPVALKDTHAVRGWPAPRFGSRTVDAPPPPEDAPVVAVFRDAGAVLFARTLASEFGWKALGDSPLNGVARNPWHPEHTPGGSSAGSAVAVATRVTRIAQGGDGGGSIRIPASFTGIFGLKPSSHRVASLPSTLGSMPVQGVLTPTAAETAAVFDVLTRPHPADSQQGAYAPVGRLEPAVAGLRVALSADLGFPGIDAEVRAGVERAADLLERAGAHVEPVNIDLTDARGALDVIWSVGMRAVVGEPTTAQRAGMDPGLLRLVDRAEEYSAIDLQRAQDAQRRLSQRFTDIERSADLILSAVALTPPPRIGEDVPQGGPFEDWLDWAGPSWVANMARRPAASVPVDVTRSGLPIGVQLLGPMLSEARLLAASMAVEMSTGLAGATPTPTAARGSK